MATSVHIPRPLLAAVDRRARQLKVSRNRLIVQALEREIARDTEWSPGFFEELSNTGPEERRAADEMLREILSSRTSKKAPRL